MTKTLKTLDQLGRVHRRDLLRAMSALGLGAAGMSALGTAALAQDAGDPQTGGTLVFSLPSDPPNFDVIATTTSRVLYPMGPCYNNLIMYDPLDPEAIIGDLAESWEVSDDGLTYTFTLIQTASFHDGEPFTSEDVLRTFEIMANPPEGQGSPRQFIFDAVSEMTAPDDYTFVITLSRPNPALLGNLANGACMIMPAHILDAKGSMAEDVVGTGPFRLVEYVPGVSIELEANPDYHKPDLPYLDGIMVYIVPEESTRMNYFRTGQIHLWDGMPGATAAQAEEDFGDQVTILRELGSGFDAITMNVEREPFGDIRVREAVSLALDRQNGIDVIWQGLGGVTGAFPGGMWSQPEASLAEVPGFGPDREADLARARELLAEAGFPDGFSTTMLGRNNAGTVAVLTWAQDQLARVGIDVTLDIAEDASALPRFAARDYDMQGAMFAIQGMDPDAVFGDFYATNGSSNYANTTIPGFDELVAEISQELDEARRIELTNEAELLALNHFGLLPLYFKIRNYGTQNSVHDFLLHPVVDNNLRHEVTWLSS